MGKRILVICQHYWPENFRVTDLCEGLVEKGYEIEVLCGIPNYPKGIFYNGYSYFKKRTETHNGVKIYRTLEIPRKGNSNLRIFLNYISFPIFSMFYLPRLIFNKYDKILIYQFSPVFMGLAGILLGKATRVEVTTYVLDLWPENLYSVLKIKNKLLKRFLFFTSTWFYKNSHKIITISPAMSELLQNRTKKPNNKILTAYQYCEKIYETSIKDENLMRQFSNRVNLVFTGNISPAQSLETVVKAANLLKKNGYKDKIHFIIVGDGMSMKDLVHAIKGHHLEKMFSLEGIKPMHEIPKYTNIADALLVTLAADPLLKFSVPAKVTSYIAAGKPLLAAVNGATAQLIKEIDCGFVSKPGNYKQLTANILKIYNLKGSTRKTFEHNAKSYHFKHLERNKSIDKIIRFILEPQ